MKCGDGFAAKATSRITLQSPVVAPDLYGGRSSSWLNEADLWAIVTPSSGRESFLSAQLQSRVTHTVVIRYRSSISDTQEAAKCRVKLGERYMNVQAVQNLGKDMKTEGNEFQRLLCVEGEPA
jgi:SPP1 family predicted phage head-tail adaptor